MNEIVTLPTGYQMRLSSVTFDPGTNRFYLGGFEVTEYLTRAQMLLISKGELDIDRANIQANNRARELRGLDPLSEDTAAVNYVEVLKEAVSGIANDAASSNVCA